MEHHRGEFDQRRRHGDGRRRHAGFQRPGDERQRRWRECATTARHYDYDDTGSSNVASRNNGHTNAIGAGTIQLLGANNATSTETFLGFTVGRGEDVVNAVANGTGQANHMTLTSSTGTFSHGTGSSGGASVVFEGTGLGTGDAAGAGLGSITIGSGSGGVPSFQERRDGCRHGRGSGYQQRLAYPWALAVNSTTGATTFATADSTTGLIRNLNANESHDRQLRCDRSGMR